MDIQSDTPYTLNTPSTPSSKRTLRTSSSGLGSLDHDLVRYAMHAKDAINAMLKENFEDKFQWIRLFGYSIRYAMHAKDAIHAMLKETFDENFRVE